MPLSNEQLGPWGNRVKFSPGPDGFAYRPGVFLAPNTAEVIDIVDGALGGRATPDQPDEGQEPDAVDLAGFRRWHYPGDVLRAVRQLRAAGVEKAQPVHVFFADQWRAGAPDDGSLWANPVYANPVYANPVYANPVYANPVYANPVYANGGPGLPLGSTAVQQMAAALNPLYSRVYPNPVYAGARMTAGAAARYRGTGARRSEARPAPGTTDEPCRPFDATPDWGAAPVRVLVLDTGLTNALAGNAAFSLSDRLDDFDHDSDGYLDPVGGHGTFIAGIIRRLAPQAAICVKQVLSSFGDGGEDEIIKALRAAADMVPKPDIVSLSFSGYTMDDPDAFKAGLALLAGNSPGKKAHAVIVASAGNDGIDRIAYPAGFEGVVAVGALGPDGPAAFSNHGEWVTASAPGVDVTSTFFADDFAAEHKFNHDPDHYHGRAVWSGTSFAAPVVAGAIARAMSDPVGAGAGGMTPAEAAGVVIDQPGLMRLPGYGTVVNVLGARPDLVW